MVAERRRDEDAVRKLRNSVDLFEQHVANCENLDREKQAQDLRDYCAKTGKLPEQTEASILQTLEGLKVGDDALYARLPRIVEIYMNGPNNQDVPILKLILAVMLAHGIKRAFEEYKSGKLTALELIEKLGC